MAPTTTPTTPITMEQLRQLIQQLSIKITILEQQNRQLQYLVNQLGKAKLITPDKYRGNKVDLTRFLTQIQAYLQYYPEKFVTEETKVFFTTIYLEQKALKQFEPTIKDYLAYNSEDDRDDFTNTVFSSYKKFKKEIQKVFRDTDKKLYTQERLIYLQQTKSASTYTTLF